MENQMTTETCITTLRVHPSRIKETCVWKHSTQKVRYVSMSTFTVFINAEYRFFDITEKAKIEPDKYEDIVEAGKFIFEALVKRG